jgi:hypothetical protein
MHWSLTRRSRSFLAFYSALIRSLCPRPSQSTQVDTEFLVSEIGSLLMQSLPDCLASVTSSQRLLNLWQEELHPTCFGARKLFAQGIESVGQRIRHNGYSKITNKRQQNGTENVTMIGIYQSVTVHNRPQMTYSDKAKSTKALQESYKRMLFDCSLSTLANTFFPLRGAVSVA